MVEIQVLPQGKEIINRAHCNKKREEAGNWGVEDNDSCWKALMIASEYIFRDAVTKKFDLDGYNDENFMPVEEFSNWIQSTSFFDYRNNKSKNPNQETSQKIIEDYIESVRKRPPFYRKITVGNIVDFIKDKNKLVRCKGVHNGKFKQFLGGKIIEKDIFIAFWKALEIQETWEKFVVVKSPIYSEEIARESFLLECLTSLNHTSQIRLIQNQICTPNNQVRAFLFINQCPHSQSWMLHRIKYEIHRSRFPVEIKPLNQKNNYAALPTSEIEARFFQEAKYLNVSEKQLIFTLNIDNYDPDAVKSIIKNCWLPVLESANKIRPNSVLLFLMDRTSGKDWQENNNILQDYMAQLPCHLPASSESQELENLILGIASRFIIEFQYTPKESCNIIAEKLINKFRNHHQTLPLFAEICQYFNCSPKQFEKQWKNYHLT
jgi:hypothetical protein